MPNITITISDLPNGQGAVVSTDGQQPSIGQACTPAQALAMDLLRLARNQAQEVRYGAEHIPLAALASDLLNPEALGHAATPEIRDRVRRAMGRPGVEVQALRGAA